MIKDFRNDVSNDKTKDGLARDLFPLTSEEQKDYVFRLVGQEMLQGRSVYHLSFWPRDKDEIRWAGEAYIDAEEFQPVRVFTNLARRVPLVVRTLLGIPFFRFLAQTERSRTSSSKPPLSRELSIG